MDNGSGLVEIIIFALIAAFFVLWFRSILGQRHGDERQRDNPYNAEKKPQEDTKKPQKLAVVDNVVDLHTAQPDQPQSIATLIRAIQAQDSDFDEKEFLGGAESAFTYIVEAFAEGDIETLEELVDGDVVEGFKTAIEERAARSETLISKILSVTDVDIVAIDLQDSIADITVNIESQQSHLVLCEGEDQGSKEPADIETIVDVWTFRRNLSSENLNWSLVRTDTGN